MTSRCQKRLSALVFHHFYDLPICMWVLLHQDEFIARKARSVDLKLMRGRAKKSATWRIGEERVAERNIAEKGTPTAEEARVRAPCESLSDLTAKVDGLGLLNERMITPRSEKRQAWPYEQTYDHSEKWKENVCTGCPQRETKFNETELSGAAVLFAVWSEWEISESWHQQKGKGWLRNVLDQSLCQLL